MVVCRSFRAVVLVLAAGFSLTCGDSAGPDQVIPKITTLTLTPALDTLTALGATVNVTVHASTGIQGYAGGSYTWELTDTSVARLLPYGLDSVRTVQASKNGSTFLRVREAGGVVDSARIVVRQRPKTIFLTQQLRAYRACPFRLTAFVVDSLNSPVANANVTWSSTDTTLARIDSTGLLTPLAPGLDTIVVQAGPVSRRAAMTIGVAPIVTLHAFGAASAVHTVGRGQFALGFGSLGGGYSDAPARFSIVSSDTTVLAVPFDTSAIAGQPEFGPLRLVGRALGTVTLTPYLCDVPGASVAFTVTRPVLAVYGDLVTNARIDDAPGRLAVLTRDTTGALQTAADPVTVRITSTDTTVLRPDSVYHHVPAGSFRADLGFTFPDSGSARLIIRDSAGLYAPDSTALVHVSYPPIYFSDGDTLRVGMRQRAYPPNQHPQVEMDRLVGGAPITIHLSTTDSTLARLTPDSVVIPVGGSGAPVDIAGGDTRGTVTLTAHATRHLDGHLVVKVDRPKVFMGYGNFQLYPGDSMGIQVSAWDSATFYPGYPTENVTFDLSASDTSVLAIHPTTLTIPAGAAVSTSAWLRATGLGTTSVIATDPRPVPYAYATDGTIPVTVIQPYLTFNSAQSVGIRQVFTGYVVENGPFDHGVIVVHMRQRSPAVLMLSDTVFTIGPGEMASPWSATGATSGVDTIIVSASGFKRDTSIVTVGPGRIALGGQPPASMVVGDSFPEVFYLQAPDGTGSTTADTVVFTLAPNANFEFHQDGAVISSITIPAGQTYTQSFFYMKAKAAGTGSATISAPNYTPLTFSVTISP